MCGIYGFSTNSQKEFENETLIRNMMSASQFRGPDNSSFHVEAKISLGHNRLSIIDLSDEANQPFQDKENGLIIIFNGEIYNYEELKKELKSNHIFKTKSDTEVLLKSYIEWGSDCLKKIDGMFSFAIWDKNNNEIFFARDYFGEKPLFYYFYEKHKIRNIVFASDLNSLSKGPYFDNQLSLKGITKYFHNNYFLDNNTVYQNVLKFPKGSFGIFKNNELKISSYIDKTYKFKNTKIDYEYIDDLLLNTVKSRMISDVPVGVFLSGGLDSSIIAYYASKIKADITTFTIGFEDKSYDESTKAEKVSRHLNLENKIYQLKNNDIGNLEKIVHELGEPLADSSIIPTYYLSKFSRLDSKVCLSGDGGDEMFFGYTTYNASKLYKFVNKIGLRRTFAILNKFIQMLPEKKTKVNYTFMFKKFFSSFDDYKSNPHLFWRQIIFNNFHYRIFKDKIKDEIINQQKLNQINKFNLHPNDNITNNKIDFDTFLENDILVKTDRTSMANSLEVRSPFLNFKLKEYLDNIRSEDQFSIFSGKKILKKIASKKFPESIIHQKKRGFNAPISYWFLDKYAKLLKDLIYSSNINLFFDEKFVNFLITEHIGKKKDYSLILFNILIFLIWSKRNPNYL